MHLPLGSYRTQFSVNTAEKNWMANEEKQLLLGHDLFHHKVFQAGEIDSYLSMLVFSH